VSGVRTTYGSPIYSNHVPSESDATVARLEQNGAIPIAKSNVPEWAGGHTFNPVFGTTRNPWNTNMSAGGSSGGSAAALATGMVWLATGNDLGGSLRTPAAFNGVVGLRPGPGIVPRGKRLQPFDTLWVEGPMARNISDLALMLDAGVGHVKEDPLSFSNTGLLYTSALKNNGHPKRVAFSKDLNVVNVSRDIAEITKKSAQKLTQMGLEITDETPDFSGVLEAFQTLRAVLLGTMMGPLLEEHRDRIAPEIVGNVERGFEVTPQTLFEAKRIRWQLYQKMIDFFETHDYLICPAASIAPFPIEQRYVTEIDGQPCKTYIDWFSITFALTMTSCPVLSLPCGFTEKGLPVGLQIVARPRGEAELLRDGFRMEEIFGMAVKLPINPKP
jgi:amidase